MNDQLIQCPCPNKSTACYKNKINEDLSTELCFSCGFTTTSKMLEGSDVLNSALETSPELYKDIIWKDEEGRVWVPSTITLPNQGMVFVDGTDKNAWKWAAVTTTPILEEEAHKFPKGQTHKTDMKSMKHFNQNDFMDALEVIGFFNQQ